jgi:RNA polymerase sigma factor (sigma-70 family)
MRRSSRRLKMERSELEHALAAMHADCWGWALACVGRDHDLAQDVLQMAYVRMLSGAASFDARSTPRTWAFGVVRLVALEELRRRRRLDGRTADVDAGAQTADGSPGPDVVTEHAERAAALTAALSILSSRQREVLQLVFYHGLSIQEAAGVMRVSLGSARTHYDRGKKALALEVAHLREDAG